MTQCPCCKEPVLPQDYGVDSFIGHFGATLNCVQCGKLLVIREAGELYDFHKWLHAQDARWPEDGEGTHSVTVGGD